jgi:hypothetical protein
MDDQTVDWGQYKVQITSNNVTVTGPNAVYANLIQKHVSALLNSPEFSLLEQLAGPRALFVAAALFKLPDSASRSKSKNRPTEKQIAFAQAIGCELSNEPDRFEVGFQLNRYTHTRDFIVDVWRRIRGGKHPYDSGISRDALDAIAQKLSRQPEIYIRIETVNFFDPDGNWKNRGPSAHHESDQSQSYPIVEEIAAFLRHEWRPPAISPHRVQNAKSGRPGCIAIITVLATIILIVPALAARLLSSSLNIPD